MKNILILSFFLASLTACKKEYHFKTEQITERDSNGNLIGNVNPEDWQLKPLSEANEFEQAVFNKIPMNFNDNLINYTLNCQDTFQFEMKGYPNPMGKSINLKFGLTTNLHYVKGFILVVDKKGQFLTGSEFVEAFDFNRTSGFLVNKLINRDFIFYYIFITADNCGYYGKGNVIGAK